MSPTRELVIVILLGSSAVVFGRVDVGKAFGKARAILRPENVRGRTSEVHQLPVKVRVSDPNIDGIQIHSERPNALFAYEPIDNNQSKTRHASPPGGRATPCHTVEQWEGRASEWDHIQGVNNRFNITFDGINRRKRIMEDKHAQLPGKRIYEYIMLYDEGIQYVINHNYNTCTVEQLGTWRNFTIPPNATLEDYYEIGAPGSGFMVQEWSDRIPGRQKESWIGTFTEDGCWPVTEIFMDKDENLTMIQSVSTRFFDLRTGISNMSVFTPPAFCNTTNLATTPATTPEARTTNPKARLHSTRRLTIRIADRHIPSLKRGRTIDVSRWPNERSLLQTILSGNHRELPEGMDRSIHDILHKAYYESLRTGRDK